MSRISQVKRSMIDALRQVKYFVDFDEGALQNLVKQGFPLTFSPHEFVCWEGEVGSCFYIVLQGTAEGISQQAGKLITVFKPGDAFGEISVLLGVPRTLSVRALTETRLFVIQRSHFHQLFVEFPSLAQNITHKLCARWNELIDMGVFDASDRTLSEAECIQMIYRRIRVVCQLQESSFICG